MASGRIPEGSEGTVAARSGLATFERFDEPSISDYALKLLRADILAARLAPGAKLPLKVLAGRYGVGINPLREALARLAGDGLVTLESQRGFRVAPASLADFEDVARNRRLIETTALAWSVERGGPAWRRDVTEARLAFAAVVEKVGDREAITEPWERPHREYHMAIVSACGSPILLEACRRLHDRYDRYRRIAVPSRAHMAGVGGDHDDIAEAALAGDGPGAAALLAQHIDDTTALVTGLYGDLARP